jgi:Ca2+-binding EF-hand superfamily protein
VADKEELLEIFEHFDGNDDGRIDRAEFKRLMDALCSDMPEEELDVGFDVIDANEAGAIDFEEFMIWWSHR